MEAELTFKKHCVGPRGSWWAGDSEAGPPPGLEPEHLCGELGLRVPHLSLPEGYQTERPPGGLPNPERPSGGRRAALLRLFSSPDANEMLPTRDTPACPSVRAARKGRDGITAGFPLQVLEKQEG